jgi:hypothetical protein
MLGVCIAAACGAFWRRSLLSASAAVIATTGSETAWLIDRIDWSADADCRSYPFLADFSILAFSRLAQFIALSG